MNFFNSNRVAVLVATANRSDLLASRALPSIKHQTRVPWRVVVVDDSGDDVAAMQTERLVQAWKPVSVAVDFLRNRRTKGASGAWNSGLDHLLRVGGDPERTFVAILDDDDQWLGDHLGQCLTVVERGGFDMVAAPFWRIEEGAEPALQSPPSSLELSDFLVGNPGIQASSLVCRLSVLLEAGLFDESLPSCTDRDLCIRIAELPGIRYCTTVHPTVRHFACRSRSRLSTYGSPLRFAGLDGFFRKYRDRMTEDQRVNFRVRAKQLFGWVESPRELAVASDAQPATSEPVGRYCDTSQDRSHLIVGIIADTNRLKEVRALLRDFGVIAKDPGLSGLDIIVLENSDERTADGNLRALVERERTYGMRIHLVDRTTYLEHADKGLVVDGEASQGCKLPIAGARTAIQTYLYAFAKHRPGAVVWIVDDDMRLNPLVADKGGRLQRRQVNLVPILRHLRALHNKGRVDVAIGVYTGAPPLPSAATVRVQLVDLVASLEWLATQEPNALLPDRSAENAALRLNRRDYYYDLSRSETDRLETPFWVTPSCRKESVLETFKRVAGAVERIVAGELVFRPLVTKPGPLRLVADGLQRGGNTVVLDIESLRLSPNPSHTVDGRTSRRSDMLWAQLQRNYFNRRVSTASIALYHDRCNVEVDRLDVESIVDDIRGYAMFSALQDKPQVFDVNDESMTLVESEIEGIAERAEKYLEERVAAFRLSYYRIRGLVGVLRELMDDKQRWWTGDALRTPVEQLRSFIENLNIRYDLETLERIECEAGALNIHHIREFLEQVPLAVESHQRRFDDTSSLTHELEGERIANAKTVAKRIASPAGKLTVLGLGAEGVVFSDGTHVFKVFDYWKSFDNGLTKAYLRSLVGAWTDIRSLYPLLDFRESGHHAVLIYEFEESECYTGGNRPGMVELLVECRRCGIVCRNLHPDNLRVVDGRVRLIDYGSDIRPLGNEYEYMKMCQRAWLSFRWASRDDLKAVMREALNGGSLPELDGFNQFYEAVLRATGCHEQLAG